jgi:predicted ATP-binding protein involved in virulence
MRLKRVHVTGLFGLFDHEIPLNLDERITIIHGPNGFGKTIVLRMVAALISGEYSLFSEVPFASFTAESDSGLQLQVDRKEVPERDEAKRWESDIYVRLQRLGENEPRYWHMLKQSEIVGGIVIPLYPPGGVQGELESARFEPKWVAGARSELPGVRLIRTERLDFTTHDEDRGEDLFKLAVQTYSEDMSIRIQQTLAEYAARSQELDRTFPTRLLNQAQKEPLTAEALRRKLADLEQKRSSLTRLGFLDPEQGLALNETSAQAIEAKRDVLTVYVKDMEEKLSIFDEMASRIQLFARIINDRFLLKSLSIHREQGFVFTSATGAHLKPSALSSGEQHELVLFYELLFKMKKNELLLIDEPEISLEDLSQVVKLSEIDVVLATHSPEIIGDHWDLTVELKGPAELMKR